MLIHFEPQGSVKEMHILRYNIVYYIRRLGLEIVFALPIQRAQVRSLVGESFLGEDFRDFFLIRKTYRERSALILCPSFNHLYHPRRVCMIV